MASIDGMTGYLNTDYATQNNNANADKISNKLGAVNANSSDEELTEAVESFESYMLEQVIKSVKKTIKMDEEESDANSQIKDYYMDSTIQDIASMMVKEYGGRLTEDLVTQMKRNYGMDTSAAADEATETTAATEAAEVTEATDNVTPEQAAAAATGTKEEDEE